MKNKLLSNLQYRITGIYLIAGLLWILFSDRILLLFTDNPAVLTQLQTYKGWFFIALTSALLFGLLLQYSKRINAIMSDLHKAKQKSEESERLKSAFLANISHEVRTPLNAILGFSELLKDTTYSEQKRISYLTQVIHNGESLLMLMNNIIDVSIIESGQTRKDVEKIKISSFIDEIVANQDSLIHSTSAVKFLAHNNVIHQANTDIVFQDKKKLQKIITQVLNNAFKFTKQGYIKLTLELINSSLVITISDTGIGIPPDQFSNIFQKFRQLEEGYQRFYGGSGIGLYIANEYTRILGGTIKVSSILGSGSTFSIQIPLAENPSSSTINLQHENTMNWSNKTFLVVEDIMSNYEVIEAMLKPTKAKLLWTKDGLDAIKTFKATPAIDLALVDINIPLLSGIEVCKTIKKYRPALPVIVQTAYSNSIQNNDFQEIGCNLVIEKPIKRKALIEAIQNLLVK